MLLGGGFSLVTAALLEAVLSRIAVVVVGSRGAVLRDVS